MLRRGAVVNATEKTVPGAGPCPKREGEGGRFAEECPALHTEWIECRACEGTGEYWPDDDTFSSHRTKVSK